MKKGDNVTVISGKDKGKTGEIIQVLKSKDKVKVRGVNIVKKHRKPTQENPGKIDLELIEIQSGAYLDEDDIVRFEDRYGRV